MVSFAAGSNQHVKEVSEPLFDVVVHGEVSDETAEKEAKKQPVKCDCKRATWFTVLAMTFVVLFILVTAWMWFVVPYFGAPEWFLNILPEDIRAKYLSLMMLNNGGATSVVQIEPEQ